MVLHLIAKPFTNCTLKNHIKFDLQLLNANYIGFTLSNNNEQYL